MNCDVCGPHSEHLCEKYAHVIKDNLFFDIRRFARNEELLVKKENVIKFPERFRFGGSVFKLCAIVNHLGKTLGGGHYMLQHPLRTGMWLVRVGSAKDAVPHAI